MERIDPARRQEALYAAVHFARANLGANRPTTARELLKIADHFYDWLDGNEEGKEKP